MLTLRTQIQLARTASINANEHAKHVVVLGAILRLLQFPFRLHYIARIEPQLVNHTSGVFTLRMCTRMHRLGAC